MLSLFPERTKMSEGEEKSLFTGKGKPPLNIRSDFTSSNALIDGLDLVPVFNYQDAENNDLDFDACPYVDQIFTYNDETKQEQTYAALSSYIMPIIRHPLAMAAQLNAADEAALTYRKAYTIADHIKAYDLEGIPRSFYITPEQWYYARTVSVGVLTLPNTDDGRKLKMTKLMKVPLAKMQSRVDRLLGKASKGENDNNEDLKFMIYSGHDD